MMFLIRLFIDTNFCREPRTDAEVYHCTGETY